MRTYKKSESSEQLESRLEKCCECTSTCRKNETSEQQEIRLAKKGSYRKLVAGTKDATKNNDNLTSGSTCDISLYLYLQDLYISVLVVSSCGINTVSFLLIGLGWLTKVYLSTYKTLKVLIMLRLKDGFSDFPVGGCPKFGRGA